MMTDPVEPDRASGSRHPRFRVFRFAALTAIGAALLWYTAGQVSKKRREEAKSTRLIARRDRYQAKLDRLENAAEEADRARRIILGVLRECRVAEDIPQLSKHHVVSQNQSSRTLLFHVPSGKHVLEIQAKWGPSMADSSATPKESSQIEGARKTVVGGEKTWTIPLPAHSGYRLQMPDTRGDDALEWRLTSNHKDFVTRAEDLPVEGFRRIGWSYGTRGIVGFPNLIRNVSSKRLQAAVGRPSGQQLWEVTLSGKRQDQPFRVRYAIRLISDCPAYATARAVRQMRSWMPAGLQWDYQGAGKYALRQRGQNSATD